MALTLDDCLRRDMLVAKEVLKERRLPCTFFIPTNYASKGRAMWPNKLRQLYSVFPEKGNPDERIVTYLYNQQQTKEIEKEVDLEIGEADLNVNQNLEVLSWEEVKRIREDEPNLFSFQSHTASHPKLSLLNKEELQEEFGESKSALLGQIDENQDVICYPYGSEWHIGDSYKVAASYYKFGLALIPGLLNQSSNPMYIPRIAFYPVDSRIRVLLKISMTIFKSILTKK
jgi:peptidoglycan/xylan/chitin deacetylase (PgdA/CDA1 family)